MPSPSLSLSCRPVDTPVARTPLPRLDVLKHFDSVFSETPATTATDIEDAFRLRYQVYCLDRGFESAEACPQGMERDSYDAYALHCLLRERAGTQPIGTVRLVRPAATPAWFSGLPLAAYAPQESMADIMRLPAGTTAEVSRFAITRAAREVLRASSAQVSPKLEGVGEKLLPFMSLGLIRGLVRLSMQHGVTHWCLAAEPSLLRRLRSFGLHFTNAGPLVDHRGLRQVCYAELGTLLERAEAERPEFWDIMTEGGLLMAGNLAQNAA
ncbi:MAG: hypothetical protein Tsb0032_01490 [Kiloniellaceae bacterium]